DMVLLLLAGNGQVVVYIYIEISVLIPYFSGRHPVFSIGFVNPDLTIWSGISIISRIRSIVLVTNHAYFSGPIAIHIYNHGVLGRCSGSAIYLTMYCSISTVNNI